MVFKYEIIKHVIVFVLYNSVKNSYYIDKNREYLFSFLLIIHPSSTSNPLF